MHFAQRPEMNEQETYWVKAFENLQPALELPADRNRPSLKTYHGGTLTRFVPEQHWNALKQIGRGQGCTPFMTMLAACSVLLHRLTMQEDIVIGIPVGGRPFNDYIIEPCLNPATHQELCGSYYHFYHAAEQYSSDPCWQHINTRIIPSPVCWSI